MRINGGRGESAEEAVLRLVQEHAAELLRFARRYSHCADDAHDAYQRTIEVLVRRMRTEPPVHPLSWVRTVLRHEALELRVQREQLVGRIEVDLDRHEGRHLEDPAELAVGHERLRHTAEALQRLKPQEVTALVLRAEGFSYKEICARTGWSYTRCNRAITEGRRALLERLGAIESGDECARWLPLLSVLADGEATAAELTELRPHLRSCSACRATLRDFHAAPAQVAALVPPVLVLLAADPGGSLLGHVEAALHAVADRLTLVGMRLQGAFEAVSGTKLAAVAASTAALAGSGAAIERAAHADRSAEASAQIAEAAVVPAAGTPRLTTIAAALPPASPPTRPNRHPERPSEFAAPRASAPEFAHSAPPAVAEFASADPTAAPASTAAAEPAFTPVPERREPEFASP